jgi:DNA-binding transcriptional regulator LsrR (DeoR family)
VRHLTSEVRQQELDWRRSQVLQYSSQGYSMREIAQKLQIDKSSVNRDIQFLKQQAQINLQHHIHEVVPMEYERCMIGMKGNLKHVLEIAETAADPKTKLQARAIANDCYKYIMDLTTNGAIVTDAIKYVTQKQEQIDTLHKLDERIEATGEEAEQEETTTTNGVF